MGSIKVLVQILLVAIHCLSKGDVTVSSLSAISALRCTQAVKAGDDIICPVQLRNACLGSPHHYSQYPGAMAQRESIPSQLNDSMVEEDARVWHILARRMHIQDLQLQPASFDSSTSNLQQLLHRPCAPTSNTCNPTTSTDQSPPPPSPPHNPPAGHAQSAAAAAAAAADAAAADPSPPPPPPPPPDPWFWPADPGPSTPAASAAAAAVSPPQYPCRFPGCRREAGFGSRSDLYLSMCICICISISA